jgi:frataxin-like iron-binding protein CyaY
MEGKGFKHGRRREEWIASRDGIRFAPLMESQLHNDNSEI